MMIEILAIGIAAAEPLKAETASSGRVRDTYVFPDPQRVEGVHLVAAHNVVGKFFRTHDPACFRVYFGLDTSGGGQQVDFVSKKQRVIIAEEGERMPVDPFVRCGPSWTYVLDKRGRFLRKFIPR